MINNSELLNQIENGKNWKPKLNLRKTYSANNSLKVNIANDNKEKKTFSFRNKLNQEDFEIQKTKLQRKNFPISKTCPIKAQMYFSKKNNNNKEFFFTENNNNSIEHLSQENEIIFGSKEWDQHNSNITNILMKKYNENNSPAPKSESNQKEKRINTLRNNKIEDIELYLHTKTNFSKRDNSSAKQQRNINIIPSSAFSHAKLSNEIENNSKKFAGITDSIETLSLAIKSMDMNDSNIERKNEKKLTNSIIREESFTDVL